MANLEGALAHRRAWYQHLRGDRGDAAGERRKSSEKDGGGEINSQENSADHSGLREHSGLAERSRTRSRKETSYFEEDRDDFRLTTQENKRRSGSRSRNGEPVHPEDQATERSQERSERRREHSREGTGYFEGEQSVGDNRAESVRSGSDNVANEDGTSRAISEATDSFRETESVKSLPDYATAVRGKRGPAANRSKEEEKGSSRWNTISNSIRGDRWRKRGEGMGVQDPLVSASPTSRRHNAGEKSLHFSGASSTLNADRFSRSIRDKRRGLAVRSSRKCSDSSDRTTTISTTGNLGIRRRKSSAFSAVGGDRKFSQSTESGEVPERYYPSGKRSAELSSRDAAGRKFSASSAREGPDRGDKRRVSGQYRRGQNIPPEPGSAGLKEPEWALRADLERVLRWVLMMESQQYPVPKSLAFWPRVCSTTTTARQRLCHAFFFCISSQRIPVGLSVAYPASTCHHLLTLGKTFDR